MNFFNETNWRPSLLLKVKWRLPILSTNTNTIVHSDYITLAVKKINILAHGFVFELNIWGFFFLKFEIPVKLANLLNTSAKLK